MSHVYITMLKKTFLGRVPIIRERCTRESLVFYGGGWSVGLGLVKTSFHHKPKAKDYVELG